LFSNKYARLVELVDEIVSNNSKVIVFTSFNRMNDILVKDLGKRFNIHASSIDGRTQSTNRQNIVDTFSAVQGSALLVLNPIAAGAGLNITAANHVIHYNLEWNPAKEDQASARAYRRGQDRPVTIHRLFYADTIEEAIDERLNRKRNLSGTTIVGVEGDDTDYADLFKALQKSPKHQL
jgi:SNF2 family DNA or RNA helicase